MKKSIFLSIFTLVTILGIVSVNDTKVQAAVTVASMDFDLNNRIDVLDLASLADHCNLKKSNTDAKYDLNGDNSIDLYDLVEVSSVVGTKINRVPDTTDITSKFTDLNFRSFVCMTIGKSKIQYQDVKNITTLNLQNILASPLISNLNGIEYFTSLNKLYASNKSITNLDLSSNIELTELYVDNNKLTNLDLRGNSRLTNLACSNNGLTNLDISKNARLNSLDCSQNKLTSLDVSGNTRLIKLTCNNNLIGSLDVNTNRELTNLNVSYNKLGNLDLFCNTSLESLNCSQNKLTSLDLSNNGELLTFDCSNNIIKSLDISKNIKLTDDFDCTLNEITKLYSIKDTWKKNSYFRQYGYNKAGNRMVVTTLIVTVRVYE